MKLKFLLFLFIFITPCLPVLANTPCLPVSSNYKGIAKEKHVKKAQSVGFGVDGTLHGRGFGNSGKWNYDSHMEFFLLHNDFWIKYYESGKNRNNIEDLAIIFSNRPYIEKDAHGKITIIGQCDYIHKNTPHIENIKEDCRLFITLTPTNEPYNSFLLYTCKIYEGSENTEPIFEKKLDRPYFYDKLYSDFRDLKDMSECYKFFWLWLEHITNKIK